LLISENLVALWHQLSHKQRISFFKLIFLSVLVSFFDVVSIGAVIPFISVITNPAPLFQNETIKTYLLMFGFQDSSDLLLPAILLFGLSAIVAGAMRTILLWATTKFSLETCAALSANIYLKTLLQPYQVHLSRNSSKVISGVLNQINTVIYEIVLPLVILICSIIISLVILFVLITFNPLIAPLIFVAFGSIYWMLAFVTKKIMFSNSIILAKESTRLIKTVQEGLGSIRDIIIDGNQMTYWRIYQDSNLPLRKVQASIAFISNSPRHIIESLGMVLIAGLSFFLIKFEHVESAFALPIMGAIAIGAQRLLPLFQQSYACWNSIRGGQNTLKDVLDLLVQTSPLSNSSDGIIKFTSVIELRNLDFKYDPNGPFVLRQINLLIPKGARIGIVGKTGSGKSTLVDLLMGLISPTSGCLMVDQKEITHGNIQTWQRHISHVPQTIYLSDATIKENIAFGVPAECIDINRVKYAAKQAEIDLFIESLEHGYDSNVGERGLRFSGGQRQRIGIARALYKNADVIIFDEATNALDHQTETDVMNTINNLGVDHTIFIITHMVSLLKNCTKVLELNNGEIKVIENSTVI
jgi:ABC-type multidrug transport system fused ATPase/permease subunit